jgi:hypothetical protein
LYLPNNLPSPLVAITADSPCEASLIAGNNGSDVRVEDPNATPGQTLTCHLHGRLADGSLVAASVTFQPVSGCCPTFTATGGNFSPTDAGTDGL